MSQSKQNLILVFALLAGIFLFSCRKNPTAPPIVTFTTGPSITIQQLRHIADSLNHYGIQNPVALKITSNTILHGVVTADEVSGQLYKQVYIRDHSGTFLQTKNYGAIGLHFLVSTNGALYQGDSIAINLNGAWLDVSGGGSLQIDSLPTAVFPVIKVLASGLNPQPLVATLPQLNTYTSVAGLLSKQFVYDGQLVQLNNVEFISSNVNTTYATPQSYSVNVTSVPPVNINKYVCDATGNTMVAYNSGYSNFAGQVIPNNSGTITAIANLYSTMQLSIRSYADMTWNMPYTPTVYDTITQNFSCAGLGSKGQMFTAGWQTLDLIGSSYWQGSAYGVFPGYKYCPSASNYKAPTPNGRNDLWLISPPIVDAHYAYGAGYAKKIDFTTGIGYANGYRNLSVLVSNTFDGVHVIPSQWSDISSFFPNIVYSTTAPSAPITYASPHAGSSQNPNPVNISVGTDDKPYFYIAFRYQSNTYYPDSTGNTYYLGTIILKNQ